MESLQSDQELSNQNLPKPLKQKDLRVYIIIGLVLMIIVGMSAFYLGKQTNKPTDMVKDTSFGIAKPTNTPEIPQLTNSITQAPSAPDSGYTYPIIDGCDKNGCLFEDKSNDAVIGYASLKGYFITYNKKDRDVDVTCAALVIKSGNTKLIDNLIAWVKNGNSINRINDKGELLLNIDLSSLSESIQQKIKSSTESNLIDVNVIRILPRGMGAPGCTSFVDIIGVN
jgi:hypothetical protein